MSRLLSYGNLRELLFKVRSMLVDFYSHQCCFLCKSFLCKNFLNFTVDTGFIALAINC